MTSPPTIDVTEVIESRALGWPVVQLVLACAIVTFFDGYDMNVIAFAAPYFAPQYHLGKIALGHIFSAAIAGTLVGGFLFGALADRIGRRRAIILATALFGALTLALPLASTYWRFMVLRFAAGIALGGAIPLTWALGTEYVAARYRATIVTLIMLGYGIGVGVAGPVSVFIIPRFGWLTVFTVGGAASLLAAAALLRVLPESLRYLATSGRHPEALARAVRRFAPARQATVSTRYVLSDEPPAARSASDALERFLSLFEGDLGRITPLLWFAYVVSSMTTFFLATWGPIVFEGLGFARSSAAWLTTANSIAGMSGGLMVMRFTDRIGVVSLSLVSAIAVPLLIVVGFANTGEAAFIAMLLLLSVFLSGSHFGITSITGIFYPTACRGLGTGWASSIAKIGSMAGPWIGGIVLASRLPLRHIFALMAVCPAVLCVCLLGIGKIELRGRRRSVALATPEQQAQAP
jgi:MFS transporter, AAHS family, 4-hydroxybenzoate transporter